MVRDWGGFDYKGEVQNNLGRMVELFCLGGGGYVSPHISQNS